MILYGYDMIGTVAGKAGSASVDVLKNAGIVPPRREIGMFTSIFLL